jgi:hypothetical protein
MTRASRYALDLGIWGILTYAVLGLRNIPMNVGESLCGVWGCFPPLESLLAYHAFCLMLAVPPIWLLVRSCMPRTLTWIGMGLIFLAFVGIGAVTGHEAVAWLGIVPSDYRQFFLRRILYVITTNPEIPLIPALLSGAVCWIGGDLKRRKTGERKRQTDDVVGLQDCDGAMPKSG